MTAFTYYNEYDKNAAQWLRNLMQAGHIAPGYVDERSIEDVKPDDLAGFTQCHFFAGIGVWSLALRRAGWRDDQEVWTGSCPCQPFSAAGKGSGFADERHLWPAFFHLITQRQPARVYGEQVASADGLAWLDLVQTDLESAGYAAGAADLCAAGVGAPHIRQRLYWVADSASNRWVGNGTGSEIQTGRPARPEQSGFMAGGFEGCTILNVSETPRMATRVVGVTHDPRLEGLGMRHQAEGGRVGTVRPATEASESGGLADRILQQRQGGQSGVSFEHEADGRIEGAATSAGLRADSRPGPTNGNWRDADWLFCRDGKWRPVEPGTFPLAHGATARVGRLRAYGNAITPQQAEAFIRSTL